MKLLFKIVFVVSLTALFAGAKPRPVHVFMAGDSTMADKVLSKSVKDSITGDSIAEPFLERGWGQLLPEFLKSGALVVNHAKNGRSTRTFVEEGWWSKIIDNVQPGDFVILQFGHNDSSVAKGERYTNPVQFRLNFIAFVDEIRAKGGIPVLCTPVARRKFNKEGVLEPTHGVYPDIIRAVAREKQTAFIDMEKLTSEWLQSTGVEASAKFFHKYPPGVSRLYPKGLDDNTHFNEAGARIVAKMFVEEAERMKMKKMIRIIRK
jgi:lysophospholipase L1-like esterase